ncbi:M20/M25/M40 family metallo-hydrolase [Phenylobacterium sp.]|jgi:tripeptide aminopeptidase|uniref:M20/M25/M40 family metallo-hydrolase n=1 Tax=Phenylobacterium sp. TaxID=1871053 RepID=UPI0037834AF2
MRGAPAVAPVGGIASYTAVLIHLAAATLFFSAVAGSVQAQEAAVRRLTASAAFQAATAQLARDHERTVSDTIALTEIPAPPFKEAARARAYMQMLRDHGLSDVEIDAEGNVMGLRRGTGPAGGPVVAIAAHLDTVFPEGPIKVRRDGDRLHAPGIGDNSHSLAVLLAYVRALDAAGIRTRRDILFVGDVGEEGPGDLRGMRALFAGRYKDRITAFFAMDGLDAARIVNTAVGSRRYRVTFRGPGGHSYGAFGLVNPMAAMAAAVVEMNKIVPPRSPRTTYATTMVGGGTSVNAIPEAIWLEVDMRSESAAELARLDARFLEIVKTAVAAENAARSTRAGEVRAEVTQIGDRPAGVTSEDAAIVRAAKAAAVAAGFTPELASGSTDANLPISLGIPAVTIASGGAGGRAHAPDEWIELDPAKTWRGQSVGLAALVVMADQ